MTLRPKSVFITGSNRGIGLEFVKQLLGLPEPPQVLFAACRQPDQATELQGLAETNSALTIVQLDVTDYSALPSVVQRVQEAVGDEGLNLLINNAGVIGRQTLEETTPEAMRACFETNTIAPTMLTQAFLPLLELAARRNSRSPMSCSRAAVINMTSKVGSCTDNSSGRRYPYRASKAALNIVTVSLSVDLKERGIMSAVLHPGWVLTEMGGPHALISGQTSVNGMLEVMAGLSEETSGHFYDYKGLTIGW